MRSFVLSRNGVVGVVPHAGSLTPGLIAAASALPIPSPRRQPYISRRGRTFGLALATPRRESDQLDLSWLLVREEDGAGAIDHAAGPSDETRVVTYLVEAVCKGAGERGIVSVFARLPEECRYLEVFREFGFTVVGREPTYCRFETSVPEPIALPDLRRQEKHDAWAIQQLYRVCTPAAVQFAENLTSRTWEPQVRRFPLFGREPESDSFVLDGENGIDAWLRIDRETDDQNRLSIMVKPGTSRVVPALVDFALEYLSNYNPRPVVITVRDYETGIRDALEESGFEAKYARFLMVRHLGIRFKPMVKTTALGRVPN